MKNNWIGPPLALAAGLALGGCGNGPSQAGEVSLVEWTSSFGFCAPTSYCTTRLRVEGSEAVLTLESRQSPARRSTTQLPAGEVDALRRAAAQARFEGLGPTIGCPDCADGGAETLSVTTAGQKQTVTFEFRAPVEPLEPLLGQMRALAGRLRPTS
jgi:hypothetical protein